MRNLEVVKYHLKIKRKQFVHATNEPSARDKNLVKVVHCSHQMLRFDVALEVFIV